MTETVGRIAQPAALRAPTIQPLAELLQEIRQGTLRIPAFQREFVWSLDQRIKLLDSIHKDVPTGALMVWRTNLRVKYEPTVGHYSVSIADVTLPQYLLDGRQRLTTLFSALGAGLWTREELIPPAASALAPDESPWDLYFNLETQEFCAAPDADESAPLMPMSVVLDDYSYDEWRTNFGLSRAQAARAQALVARFRNCAIPVIPLVSDDLGTVTLTFGRINEGGTPVSDLHMARALSWRETADFDLVAEMRALALRLTDRGLEAPDERIFLNLASLAAGNDAFEYDVEAVASFFAKCEEPQARLNQLEEALALASEVLRSLNFVGPQLIPSHRMVALLASAFQATVARPQPPSQRELIDRAKSWLVRQAFLDQIGSAHAHALRALQQQLESALLGKPARSRSRRTAYVCTKFNLAWARSRVLAAVLAAQWPHDPRDQAIPNPARLLAVEGTAAIPQLLLAGASGLPQQASARLRERSYAAAELGGPANRFVCRPGEVAALRTLLFEGSPSLALLESHLVSAEALRELRANNLGRFLRLRADAIQQAEVHWARSHGWDQASIPKRAGT